jgi:hypothetical protein
VFDTGAAHRVVEKRRRLLANTAITERERERERER